jgi:hypothetical protein
LILLDQMGVYQLPLDPLDDRDQPRHGGCAARQSRRRLGSSAFCVRCWLIGSDGMEHKMLVGVCLVISLGLAR